MNALINENNEQYRVNEQTNNRIKLLTDMINDVVMSTARTNRVALTQLEILTSIMHIETINKILEDIQDAIVKTKVNLVSNKILSLKEIINLQNLLVDQGVKIDMPDEALRFITPKVAISKETVLYILEVPRLENEISMALKIIPLTFNNQIIEQYPQFVIKNKQNLFIPSNHNNFVQQYSEMKEFNDECIKPLVFGKQSKCNVTTETRTAIQWISDSKILINNAQNVELISNCGPDDRNVTGNFLITIANCTVTIDQEEFQSYTTKSENEEVQGALHNIQISHISNEIQDINTISQETIKNRKQLHHVLLKQYNQQNWMWSLSGGISCSSLCIIILVSYMCITKYHTTKGVRNSKVSDKTTEAHELPKTSENIAVAYSELLKEAGIKPKVEDDFFSPHGEVTST